MTNEEAIEYNKNLREYMRITDKKSEYKFLNENYEALDMAIKALETVQRIDDVLNVEGMTEIDVLDEIMEAVSEFKYDCGVDE